MKSRHSDWHSTLSCAILPNITGLTPATSMEVNTWKIPHQLNLADEMFHQCRFIDILIGADTSYEILLPNRRTRPGNYPVLQETVPGWTVSGRTPVLTVSNNTPQTLLVCENTTLETNLNRFWEVESMEQSTLTPEQQQCEEHFVTYTTQQEDG
jgi:hypothetical protein